MPQKASSSGGPLTGRLVILGSGTSFGVPVIGCDCRVCVSGDPRDRRTRTAAVVELDGGPRLLIDTPPELRLQLVRAGIGTVDAVLFTHDHADHVAGIDDLRAMSVRGGEVPVYGPPETIGELTQRFGYIFDAGVTPPPGTSKPELRPRAVAPYETMMIAGATVLSLEADHGGTRVYGYRVGPMAYLTDAKEVPARTVAALEGVEVLVVNALFEKPHATHLSIPEAVAFAQRIGARQTFLTHLTHRYLHTELESRLPAGIAPACDGLVVAF
ncbi:MAG: MBL fold metallo-hydrolase [Gemmatimonadota bacterium]|nr:MBL fold metallo-hydrolase [Gemmatimonadota bacterium]